MKLENKSYGLQQVTSSKEQLIVLLLLQKRFIEAYSLSEKELDSVQNFFNKGVCNYYNSHYDQALDCFRKALSSIANLLPASTANTSQRESIESQFYHKEREEIEMLCMQGITGEYVTNFSEITKFYLLCNILLCMEKLEMWSEIDTLGTTMYGTLKISFVQKLLAKSNSEKQ